MHASIGRRIGRETDADHNVRSRDPLPVAEFCDWIFGRVDLCRSNDRRIYHRVSKLSPTKIGFQDDSAACVVLLPLYVRSFEWRESSI